MMKKNLKVALAAAALTLSSAGLALGAATTAEASVTKADSTTQVATAEAYYYSDVRNWAYNMSPVSLNVGFSDSPAGNGAYYQGAAQATSNTSGNITLSHTVAEDWYSNQSVTRNLVVHEIGHAVSFYCWNIYNGPVFQGNDEAWAVAYAWSRGYTGDGSGANIYGYPTQTEVNAASYCR